MATNPDHHDEQAAATTPTPKQPRTRKAPAARPTTDTTTARAKKATSTSKKATSKKAPAKQATSTTAATETAAATTDTTDTTATAAPVTDPMTQIDEILRAEMRRAQVIEPQMRMLLRALTDCGLGVTADHVRIDEPTGDVAIALSWKAVKALTSALQDLAAHRPVVVVAPPAGPTLFDVLPPAGPVAPQQAGSGLHIEVPA